MRGHDIGRYDVPTMNLHCGIRSPWRDGVRRSSRVAAAVLAAAFVVATSPSGFLPRTALAATDGSFQSSPNPGSGTIVTGTLGQSSLTAATAALLRRVHADLGTRPTVVQVARNARDHSLALLFTATHNGTPYTGVGIVTAAPNALASGAALFDTTARFQTTVGPMMHRLGQITTPTSPRTARQMLAPAEQLITHPFADGTGSIGIPADWTLHAGGGGSAAATGPGGAQVSYNMHYGAFDPSNPHAQMYLRTETPVARQNMHAVVLPYTSDPSRAWVAMYAALAKQLGFEPNIQVKSTTSSGATSTITGTLGSGSKELSFLAYVFVLPPNPNGLWQLSDSHVFVKTSEFKSQGATGMAILNSIHIDQGAVAAQQQAIRNMFQKTFEGEIANDRAQDAARQQGTDEALASDRAAQEGMHRQAVSMENYSLDRAVVVNTTTGAHSTIDSGFADDLVQANSNYQKVPARNLLRGVDY
jgi:hypothetical protein